MIPFLASLGLAALGGYGLKAAVDKKRGLTLPGVATTLTPGAAYSVQFVANPAKTGSDPNAFYKNVAGQFTTLGFRLLEDPTVRAMQDLTDFQLGKPSNWLFRAVWNGPGLNMATTPDFVQPGKIQFVQIPASL